MLKWLKLIYINFALVNPFEVAFAIMFFVSGLGLLFFAPDPASIVAVFPPLMRFVWSLIVAVGGLFELSGLAINNIPLRRSGLVLMGGATTVYLIALIALYSPPLFFSICLVTGIIWACLTMYRRLR